MAVEAQGTCHGFEKRTGTIQCFSRCEDEGKLSWMKFKFLVKTGVFLFLSIFESKRETSRER